MGPMGYQAESRHVALRDDDGREGRVKAMETGVVVPKWNEEHNILPMTASTRLPVDRLSQSVKMVSTLEGL